MCLVIFVGNTVKPGTSDDPYGQRKAVVKDRWSFIAGQKVCIVDFPLLKKWSLFSVLKCVPITKSLCIPLNIPSYAYGCMLTNIYYP